MIKFDSSHKSFNKNINEQEGKKISKMIIAGLLVSSILITTSGCIKAPKVEVVDCSIEGIHAHEYVCGNFNRYLPYEYATTSIKTDTRKFNYARTDKYITLSEQDLALYQFIWKKSLIDLNENKDAIRQFISKFNTEDYYLYRYKHFVAIVMPNGVQVGHYEYYWTTTPKPEGWTGEVKLAQHVYYGYNIVLDEKGNISSLEKSEPFYNLEDLLNSDYKYVKQNFFETMIYKDVLEQNYDVQNDNYIEEQKGKSK